MVNMFPFYFYIIIVCKTQMAYLAIMITYYMSITPGKVKYLFAFFTPFCFSL